MRLFFIPTPGTEHLQRKIPADACRQIFGENPPGDRRNANGPERQKRLETADEQAFGDAGERAALKSQLLGAGLALGLLQQDPAAWFARGASGDDDARIQSLVDERATAKQSRDFTRADAIRDQLAAEGILLEDTPQGVRWKRA